MSVTLPLVSIHPSDDTNATMDEDNKVVQQDASTTVRESDVRQLTSFSQVKKSIFSTIKW